ncbi:hypothetical protein Glove_767g4 [Diversispora epigaea]|uniref:MICOS complex subunit MIC60 n=1 Tax=Diversispora epigaea TaxID=1348612 RepID=A0A397G2F5_9GLOM|nr:hypothetical protein Glove_767g4 [Diversispora epigaea]
MQLFTQKFRQFQQQSRQFSTILTASFLTPLTTISLLSTSKSPPSSSPLLLQSPPQSLIIRNFNNSTIYRAQHNETSADIEKPEKRLTPIIRNPIGAFRGGLIGFLLGLTIAGGSGYYYLLDEYHTSSNLLLSSVEELQKSTSKVRDYAQKIERLEGELKSLQGSAATTDQIKELRSETRKLFDGLNLQHLELKTNVWNIEQDVHILMSNKFKLSK